MPKVRRSRKRPPEGWDLIEETLESMEQKMREGKLESLKSFHFNRMKYLQLKLNRMKANESTNPCGRFLRSIIRNRDISMTCITDAKSSPRIFMTIALRSE